MKINKNEKKGNKVTIEIETEYSELAPHIDSAYKEAAKDVKMPGFRKGKVPDHIIKASINEDAVTERAVQTLVSDLYPKVIVETKIEPVDYPNIGIVKMEKDKPFVFKVDVDVYPEVKVGNYKGVKVEAEETEVTDKEVDYTVESMRNNLATAKKITDRGLKEKDVATIDLHVKLDGKSIPQLTHKKIKIEVGKDQILPGFDGNIISLTSGDKKSFSLEVPNDFYVDDLKGKKADIEVDLSDIEERTLPPLDDMFAKTVSKSQTIDEMKNEIKEHIAQDKKMYSEQKLRDSAVDQASELVEAEVPAAMAEREKDLILEDFDARLRRNGSNLDTYMKSVKKDVDALRNEMSEAAVKRVKAKMLLRHIVEEEKFEASKEEVDKEIEDIAKSSGRSIEDLMKDINEHSIETIKDIIVRKKAVDHLISKVKIEKKGDK